MSYSSSGILALIILLIINHDVLRNRQGREIIPAHRSYRLYLIATAAYIVTDIFWGFLYEWKLTALVYADTVLYFVFMAFTILLWTRFVIDYLQERGTFSKILMLSGVLIFCFQILMLLVNFLLPILFFFSRTSEYHAGPARYAILVVQIVMFSSTAGYAFMAVAKNTGTMRLRYRTIGWCSALMAVFVSGQAFYPLLPLYAIGCLLATCLLHSFVLENEKEEYRDDLEEKLEDSIRQGKYYDLLTGLPSMTYFFELAEIWKDHAVEEGEEPALLYMDFLGMKFFNKKYGFSEGDRLLQAFARILIRTFGSENCCRIGADHFAVFTVTDGLEEKLDRVFQKSQEMNEGRTLPVHVGIYSGQEGRIHADIACDRAKLACSELSGVYSCCYNYFSQELNDDVESRHYIVENIDRAIEQGWIRVYYQPIVRATNGIACEEEALSRWIDPEKGFLSPAEFIPALESAGMIYKLDLYVVEQVLKKLQQQKAEGINIVAQSVNLSRSDFDSCDIVEEIRTRVDASGIPRDRITIEITESVIGSNFEFIKERVERFRSLGFAVWIDDFGSGYSSLDVLQSLKFDLIKFDMGFMRKLDEGENGKIILTELMQMAASLGVDTVCEGVETLEQVRFLQEIGCSRLQGYYFSKPVPFEAILEKYRKGIQIGYENPAESSYYDAIGRVNLYDLASIVNEDERILSGFYDTLPMSVIEVRDGRGKYVRSNRSYRDFMSRFFEIDITSDDMYLEEEKEKYGMSFIRVLNQCSKDGNRAFFDERLPDGSLAHCFVRRISQNPVTGKAAAAVAVLSITEADEGASYAEIARALASDYYNIYVVDLDTEHFIEYSSVAGKDELAEERHGTDFFARAREDTMTRIYEDDRKPFLTWFSKENIILELDRNGVFTTTYRLIDTGKPMYVSMKITRLEQRSNRIILGVSVMDTQSIRSAPESSRSF